MVDHLFCLSFDPYHQTGGIKILAYFFRRLKICMFIQISFPKFPIKSFHPDFKGNGNPHVVPHFLQMVSIHPVRFEKKAMNPFFLNELFDHAQGFFGKFKAASGIDDLQNTKFSRDMRENFPVQSIHLFQIPGIVFDVVTEAAFPPGTGSAL